MAYINYTNDNIGQFLDRVHARMKVKYLVKSKIAEQVAQATKLQNFFQDLKAVAQDKTPSFYDEAILDTILYSIEQGSGAMKNSIKAKNLFSARGGTRFERDLARIYESVWNEIGEDEFQLDKVLVGGLQGNINFSQIDNVSKDIVNTFGLKTYRVLQDKQNEAKLREYYFPEVAGKVDVKGYEINIRADADPRMIEIYELLKNATFSAKNYDSMTWDEKTKSLIETTGHTSLKLGASNIFRSLYGTLSDLGYSERTIVSAIFAGYNAADKDHNVRAHLYHLRFIYELMGSGIVYKNQSISKAGFLIYNDPSGNIYVKSTLEILDDLLNEMEVNNKDFKWNTTINLAKEKFFSK